jgi:hypothetical protein
MTERDVNAEELGRLADILQTLASLASAYPERTAVESAAAVVAGEITRMPSSVHEISLRTGLPSELIWKMTMPSPTDNGPEWAERVDAVLTVLSAELLGRDN